MSNKCILFDFDNTIANTESLREIRESGDYDGLTEDVLGKIKVYKQIPAILDSLTKQQVRVGIVTNSGAVYVRRLLRHLGLEDAFEVVVTYSDVKSDGKKPRPTGIKLALQKMGIQPSPHVLYVGDEHTDIEAAYNAGVTPVVPSWASKRPVSMAPAVELSSSELMNYFKHSGEYALFAERCAEHEVAQFQRRKAYFLPLDASGNVVTMADEMVTLCLGRYFSQKAAVTAKLHDQHALSRAIFKKEQENPFVVPQYWVDMLALVVQHGAEYLYKDQDQIDVVTVIPSKRGKDPRLERLLAGIKDKMGVIGNHITFLPDLFYFVDDAKSQKHLVRNERYLEAQRALQLNAANVKRVAGKNVLVIDDVITTGSTLAHAHELLKRSNAKNSVCVAIAKTVSITSDEKECPACGRPMNVRKNAQTGERFWGCAGYYDEHEKCSYTEALETKNCPKCQRPMAIRTNSRDKSKFWGCTGYRANPSCSYSENYKATEI